MGDMKTPDFDDLLAAFDIPDATGLDAKEAIPDNHDECEGQPKSVGICLEDISTHNIAQAPDVPAVSVIVKNTSRQESCESGTEREGVHLGHLLQNGFRGSGTILDSHHMVHGNYGKFETTFVNGDRSGDCPDLPMAPHQPCGASFTQFSPISSPEPEDIPADGIVGRPKQDERPYFPSGSVFGSEEQSMLDSQRKLHGTSMCRKLVAGSEICNITDRNREFCKTEQSYSEENSVCSNDGHVEQSSFSSPVLPMGDLHGDNLGETQNYFPLESSIGLSQQCIKSSSSKLSSCLAALVALNSRKVMEDSKDDVNSRDPLVSMKESPKVPKSPKSPRSPLEVVKRFIKPPDSPMSICSDSSGKASPSVTTGSPPAIPRVRIKTIKTSSGQIKRTVTSVLPDSELDELQSPTGSSPPQITAVEEPPTKASPLHLSHHTVNDIVFENGRNKTFDKSTALVSQPSKVIPITSDCSSKKRVKAHSGTSSQKTNSSNLRVVKTLQQQKGVSVRSMKPPNTNFLPKAVHLANLNLVPHSVAASVTARSTTPRPPQLPGSMVCSTVPLVHQVKSPAPALGTTISCGAVGTLNRLLNASNPIPTYVPNLNPPPESQISLPARGHRCLECGDAFCLEASLAQHYSRRSVHIEVACMHCAKTLVFFNKCSLLAHARQHKSQGAIMQCTQLFMKPVAADQMFSLAVPTPTVAMPPVPVGSQVFPGPAKNAPAMPLYPDKVIPHGLKCLECNKQMSDDRSLAGHFQRLSEEMERLVCKLCMMTLPNKCSYRAHQRIHTHKSPYCCPECGAVSHSTDIQKHIKENCLHYARKIGNKCSHCDMFHLSFHVQKSHIMEKHCEIFYKCSLCPVAFKSSDGCLTHVKNKHDDSSVSPQMIYRCSCEMVFKKKQLLFQHFQQSSKKLTTCVFKCPECPVVFTQKQMLMQHFKGVHRSVLRAAVDESAKLSEEPSPHPQGTSLTPSRPPTSRLLRCVASDDQKDPASQKPSQTNLKNAGLTCGECLQWLPDRDAYLSHMKTSHGRSVKRYPCRNCERSFNSTTSLRRHIRNDHGGKKRTFTCWYCTDKTMTFTKHFMLKNHISLMHGIKNPDFSQMLQAAPENRKASGEGPVVKRPSDEALIVGAPDTPPAKRPTPQFRCSKCGFTTEDSGRFQEHIPQHKADDSTPQCSHCGLCFTSPLALSRHLLIVHKIKEPEEELQQDEEEEEEEEDEEEREQESSPQASDEEVDPLHAGQGGSSLAEEPKRFHCDTCSEAFGCESAYSSHMQTHSTSHPKAVPEQ
ncbi:zinc finger protein 592 [Paramormyrops kingsleyae]|uniref:zinc finger protein 592 n=1 Tax=Paramormyrops kingsleyae TaxID=1676925 RepID=UPI003B97B328